MYPDDEYAQYIENKLKDLELKKVLKFLNIILIQNFNSEIEKLNKLFSKKKKFRIKKKMFEDKEDEAI